jgi:hypothetical protein
VIDAQSCKQLPDGTPLIEVRYVFHRKVDVTRKRILQITGSQAEVWKEHSIRIITADQQEQQQIRVSDDSCGARIYVHCEELLFVQQQKRPLWLHEKLP